MPQGRGSGSELRARGGAAPLRNLTLFAIIVGVAPFAFASAKKTTSCQNLCPGTPTPKRCVVGHTVKIVPGSIIDCGTSAVQVSGGDLLVHDGQFILKAGSVTVTRHLIQADCLEGSVGQQGFTLQTTGDITVGNGGKMSVTCSGGAGSVTLTAGKAVTIGGLGIDANGQGTSAQGGRVIITAGGAVTTTATIDAKTSATSGGPASGGGIQIKGASIRLNANVVASGYQSPIGQQIVLDSSGDVTLNGALDAGTASGDGGVISVRSGGRFISNYPLKANGAGSDSRGGRIDIVATRIQVTNDLNVEGAVRGGSISLHARGRIQVGSTATLGADITGSGPGQGGDVSLASDGGDVVVLDTAKLIAEGGARGEGGDISMSGAGVTADTGTRIEADGMTDKGGSIEIEARGPLALRGTIHATNGLATFIYRCTREPCETPPDIGRNATGTLQPDADVRATCGDGVYREGAEGCDGSDLNTQTCSSQRHGRGVLKCTPSCTFDFSGCSR